MITAGLDIGSSSIKIVLTQKGKVIGKKIVQHEGSITSSVHELIREFLQKHEKIKFTITGGNARHLLDVPSLILPVSIEAALHTLDDKPNGIISMGGEEFIFYKLDDKGKISGNITGDKCASGTGEFFRQQLSRMDMTINDLEEIDPKGKVHHLSSRCSVFMKSDCTHKLNKKEATKEEIVLSLSYVMAQKIKEFIAKARVTQGKILCIGGVSQNRFVLNYLRDLLPNIDFKLQPESAYWEAYGASLFAEKNGKEISLGDHIFLDEEKGENEWNPLKDSSDLVNFIELENGRPLPGRKYIMGVDGGSTTTKVVLIDRETKQMVTSYYGRTHGDPVRALRICLQKIKEQIVEEISEEGYETISIEEIGVTGSSREILGVFLETRDIYNEIIAHATGTGFYNPQIDTVFEIGGQDAKYIYLDNKVPVDYAMNEACSAGTGSFIEESASGDLNISDVRLISDIALLSKKPARFGEHCSAFINSDIRKAIHENKSKEDIVAGILYSIVANYLNRVVGNRKIGENIVLQGGVAKNKALAYAFAGELKKNITVPPHPELMGAFGVALMANQKSLERDKASFKGSIDDLMQKEIRYGKIFRCKSCENDCPIQTLFVNEHRYFFGGRCDKYANIRKKNKINMDSIEDISTLRESLLFEKYSPSFKEIKETKLTVIIPKTFSIFDMWPLYSWFFHSLGVGIQLIENNDSDGKNFIEAPFCFPAEIAHGRVETMLKTEGDYYFLPQLRMMHSMEKGIPATLCPIVQGFPYYARSSFTMDRERILSPIIDFQDGFFQGEKPFIKMGKQMGFSESDSKEAFLKAIRQYLKYREEAVQIGKRIIREAKNKNETVIVLLGRSYNLFDDEANLGIPRKFLSRGYRIIPNDFMPVQNEWISENMYWYWGQINLKSSVIVKENPNLFAVYISNFSCAPDSFILHQIRWIMGSKPFLVLELDSHSADAGVDTRIEAFLDIVSAYRKKLSIVNEKRSDKKIAAILDGSNSYLLDKRNGEKIDFRDPRVTVLFPSMGRYASEAVAESINGSGIRSIALDVPSEETTQLARDIASGKECIPTLITMGSTLDYFKKNPPQKDKYYLVLIPSTTGPCRTGQYGPWFDRVFETLEWENVTTLPLSSDNSYTELGSKTSMFAWWALVVTDFYKDMETALQILALDKNKASVILENSWQRIKKSFGKKPRDILKAVEKAAEEIGDIEIKDDVDSVKKVLIVGEIYVRRDDFSQKQLLDLLAKNNIMGKITGVTEWVNYTSYLLDKHFKKRLRKIPWYKRFFSKEWRNFLISSLENIYKKSVEYRVKKRFIRTKLIPQVPDDMEKMMKKAEFFTDIDYETEATISSISAAESVHAGYSGVIVIAPFACLIGRLAKSIMTPYMREISFPIITIENDGREYPPNVMSQLEIFMMNVKRYPSAQKKDEHIPVEVKNKGKYQYAEK